MPAAHGRRALGPADLGVDMASSTSGATDGSDSSPSARTRKPTYIARKEEKARLLGELETLQCQLRELQQAQMPPQTAPSLLEQELATSLLRDAVRNQQLSLVQVQSAVSGYVRTQQAIPHEMTISLSRDPQQRRGVLVGIKSRKIRAAMAYLTERTRFLDPFLPFVDTSRFMLGCGDFCVLRTDIIPLEFVRASVRQVHDALLNYLSNMEMRVTDVLGDITTRDEADYGADGVQQSRCISFLSCGVHLESNSVYNSEFVECSDEYAGGGPFSVVTVDFVDQDELYPYSPTERVRLDVTAVITARSHSRRRFNAETGREEDEAVVVISRSCYLKLHRSDIALPPLVQHKLREQLGSWGDFILSSVLEQLLGHPPV